MQTTVVGNYPKIPNRPRPARLRQAINRRDRGEITSEELARIEDEVTVEVIGEQIEAGVEVITDGQARWDDDQTYVMRRLGGVEIGSLERYLDTNTYYRRPEITGPVSWREPILVRDYRFAAENSAKPLKAIITAPYTWFGSAAGILPALLDLPVATIGLDFVSGRDNWEAVKSVRFDKKLGAGIVDGRNTRIESIEQIEESIRRLSQSVTPDRIYVNPSCGLEYLPRETAFEKLKRMVDGARKAEPVAA